MCGSGVGLATVWDRQAGAPADYGAFVDLGGVDTVTLSVIVWSLLIARTWRRCAEARNRAERDNAAAG